MAHTRRLIIGGVDTHTATHHAAVIDLNGRLLADAEFPASPRGYALLLAWMRSKGRLDKVGIEGTGAYGAGLARHLHEHGVTVLEVPCPDRRLRRQHGKSDRLDAEAAARTVLAGNASGAPKLATGPIEAIRMLRVARTGAVKRKPRQATPCSAWSSPHRNRYAANSESCPRASSSMPVSGFDLTPATSPIPSKRRRPRCVRSPPGPGHSSWKRER